MLLHQQPHAVPGHLRGVAPVGRPEVENTRAGEVPGVRPVRNMAAYPDWRRRSEVRSARMRRRFDGMLALLPRSSAYPDWRRVVKASQRMRSAALREMERVQRAIGRAEARADRTRADLASQDAALDQLGAQLRNLAAIAEVDPAHLPTPAAPPISEHALHGRHIRMAAMRVVGDGERIHYREWYERFAAAGYVLACQKEPGAMFLTTVSRCPLALKAGKGWFVIDAASQVAEYERRASVAAQHASACDMGSVQRLRAADNHLSEARLHATVIGQLQEEKA